MAVAYQTVERAHTGLMFVAKTTPHGLKVAQVFRELRAASGLTQEDVAHAVDLTLSGYRPYEQGKRQLRVEQLAPFAAALNTTPAELRRRLDMPADEHPPDTVARVEEIVSRAYGPRRAQTYAAILRHLDTLSFADQDEFLRAMERQAAGFRIVGQEQVG